MTRPRLARGTPGFVRSAWLLPLVALLARRPRAFAGSLAVCLPLTWFFRDPDRVPEGPGLLAAADGLVQRVVEEEDGRWRVSTYLSLRDVHVTRAPVAGRVTVQRYEHGSHRMAFRDDSHTNERLEWTLVTPHGDLGLTQYAGTLARRIVPHVAVGDAVEAGERIGLIRFGSRVDVLLPEGVLPVVTPGRRVRGGHTVIGRAVVAPS